MASSTVSEKWDLAFHLTERGSWGLAACLHLGIGDFGAMAGSVHLSSFSVEGLSLLLLRGDS